MRTILYYQLKKLYKNKAKIFLQSLTLNNDYKYVNMFILNSKNIFLLEFLEFLRSVHILLHYICKRRSETLEYLTLFWRGKLDEICFPPSVFAITPKLLNAFSSNSLNSCKIYFYTFSENFMLFGL